MLIVLLASLLWREVVGQAAEPLGDEAETVARRTT
jgi:hypothetical protein